MEKEFVPYELAVKLKAIGFNEPCMFVHDTWGNTKNWTEYGEVEHRNSHINVSIYYSAPLFQQVFRWFRKKYGILSWTYRPYRDNYFYEFETIDQDCIEGRVVEGQSGSYDSYEEAELACLGKLIEIVESKSE